MRVRALALTAAAALALPLATMAPASAKPPIRITSIVAVNAPGPTDANDFSWPVSAEAPDGTVYLAAVIGKAQSIVADKPTGAPTTLVAATGIGTTIALAADKHDVYVGSATAINAYDRSTGALVQTWALTAKPRVLSDLVVAGDRVWALQVPVGFNRAPSTIIELDPTSATRVLTKNGVYDTFDLAASPTGIYYVTNKDSTLVHLTNAGVATSAKTHLVVNQLLAGPGAVQAMFVTGNAVVVEFSFGQGTDAEVYAYNATSLTGPGKGSSFSDGAELTATTAGLMVVANPEADICPTSFTQLCLRRFALGGPADYGNVVKLSYDEYGPILGPHAAIVVQSNNKQRVVRIG
ncbi:hypothetical protein acdb102_03330 [Acidothermaceae bacterium B102]|nr:hypothetical protein acdb102_03330 [Acidothermaceae bacterium B102]